MRTYPEIKPIPEIIFGTFTDVWFLWTLFWISIVVAVAIKVSNNKWYILGPLLIVGAVVLYYIPVNEGNLFMYPYFLLGLFFSRYEGKLQVVKVRKLIVILAVALFIVLLYRFTSSQLISIGGLYVTGRGNIFDDLYRYFIGCVGIIAFLTFCVALYGNLEKMGVFVSGIVKLAKYSGELYCTQQVLVAKIGAMIIGYVSLQMGYNPLTYNIFVFEILAAPMISWVIIFFFMKAMDWMKKYGCLYKALFGW